jgi:elongator complex protein 3
MLLMKILQTDRDYNRYLELLVPLLKDVETAKSLPSREYFKLVKRYPKPNGDVFAKDYLIGAYRKLAGSHGLAEFNQKVIDKIKMKPVRTISGVTPMTVLTKPFPCPGQCIFCPSDVRMPKSYLSDEPGAQRAERNYFDPYLQTYNRLQAYKNMGHPTEKVEIIILGGTWSFYPEDYQIWFIKECFRALNEFDKKDGRAEIEQKYQQMRTELKEKKDYAPSNDPKENQASSSKYEIDGNHLDERYNQVISEMYVAPERKAGFDKLQVASWDELFVQHKINETAAVRSVGLVIETRPDNISPEEVIRIRKLGCTKTQIGVQSLQDQVLEKNKRGHDVAATRRAFKLLRQAGFKIHAHWMANLHGSTVDLDKEDFDALFTDSDFKPDELKIYPCSLIDSAELMQYHQRGEWQPYTHQELLEVVTHTLETAPEYTRLTRVIRDIPSTDIVVGNKLTNFRQVAQKNLNDTGKQGRDIRAREVRNHQVDLEKIEFSEIKYKTSVGQEIFIQATAPLVEPVAGVGQKLLGFLRLSLPSKNSFIDELSGAAMIREIHVYGPAQGLGKKSADTTQHQGLGTQLMEQAKQISTDQGFAKLAVISAIGTREYYRKRGFADGDMYQIATLK